MKWTDRVFVFGGTVIQHVFLQVRQKKVVCVEKDVKKVVPSMYVKCGIKYVQRLTFPL